MKTKKIFIKGFNWVLAGILGMLGFTGCGKVSWNDVEYGTPNADFKIKGVVVSKTTGIPVEGVQVTVPRVVYHQRPTSSFIPDQSVITYPVNDTLYTKGKGDFTYNYTGIPTNDSINFIIKFEDTAEIKRFKTDSVKVTFFSSELKGGDNRWYVGAATKEVEIKLDDQEGDE